MFSIAPLPYSYDALEPYIDAETMELHYSKHYEGYVNKLNAAVEKRPELFKTRLPELLAHLETIPEDIRKAVRDQGGGAYNHGLFWRMMKPGGGGDPHDKLGKEIVSAFGTFESFQEKFNEAAKSVFGSGWAWLVVNGEGKLEVTTTANQDTPLARNMRPILGIDVWEHAYYLKYHNMRVDYIKAWWHVVNWDTAEENYINP